MLPKSSSLNAPVEVEDQVDLAVEAQAAQAREDLAVEDLVVEAQAAQAQEDLAVEAQAAQVDLAVEVKDVFDR